MRLSAALAALLALGLARAAPAELQQPQQQPQQQQQHVTVGVYMESLCPDSRRFVLSQLVPAQLALGSQLLRLELVPFGHARVLGPGRMVCQHGQRECDGNRLMACVLARARNQTDSLATLACLFEARDSPAACLAKHLAYASPQDVDRCRTGAESADYMAANERATGRIGYVPKVTLDGQHSDDIQAACEFGLRDCVCKRLLAKTGRSPAACSAAASAAASAAGPQR